MIVGWSTLSAKDAVAGRLTAIELVRLVAPVKDDFAVFFMDIIGMLELQVINAKGM